MDKSTADLFSTLKRSTWNDSFLAEIETLVKDGASIQAKQDGNTVLHAAIESSNLDAVKFLLSKKASVNATNAEGISPLQYSLRLHLLKNQDEITKELIDAEALISPSLLFECLNDEETMNILFNADPNLNLDWQDKDGLTVLHVAAATGNFKSVKFMISKGANAGIKDKMLRTPAHYLASPKLLIDMDGEDSAVEVEKEEEEEEEEEEAEMGKWNVAKQKSLELLFQHGARAEDKDTTGVSVHNLLITCLPLWRQLERIIDDLDL